ncbi:hypothetical protein EA472_03305 [Natrarchaeobius oligotrophus]|uniref:Uncharacterized protein n=1 Tax=Natrarchaeobius chitinivorans TaxID=1679083 RepID=A0A3N6N0J1_NATCH|nr:hypothetical protein EA472_03305 [Natrarchaeobius chitinivorans]
METLDKPFVIQVAPTGSFLKRDTNPNQAYTPEEVAEQAIGACDASAAMCHFTFETKRAFPISDRKT